MKSLVRHASSSSLPPYVLNVPPTKITTLQNKLRVATEENYGETATIGVWIDTGSAFEDEKTNGVAHFLEHMAFKGTTKRTRGDFELEIENMGASLNAYTSREQTVYYAKVFKNDVPKAVEIIADILTNSKFDQASIESERSTILREMQEVNKDYNEVVFDHLHAAAFQGTGLGRTILGPEENIKTISRNDLVNFTKTHYHTPRMVLVGAGGVKHSELVSLGEKYFSNLPQKSEVPIREKSKFTGSQILVRDDTMEEAHVVAAVEAVSWSHPDYFTFSVLQTIFGNWDKNVGGGKNLSSRICEIVATEKLASSLSSFHTAYSDTGLFGAHVVAKPEQLDDVLYEVFNEWVRIGRSATDAEVERAKAKLKSSLLLHVDGTTSVAEDIGRQLLTIGRRMSPAELFLRIDAVTAKDVMRVARQYCEDVDPVIAGVGTLETIPDYNTLRGYTYWNRL